MNRSARAALQITVFSILSLSWYCAIGSEYQLVSTIKDWKLFEHEAPNLRLTGDIALSNDGKRLGIVESLFNDSYLGDDLIHPVRLAVWETETAKLISKVERLYDANPASNMWHVDLWFSGDSKALVVGMPVGSRNFTWNYEIKGRMEDSCGSYMGANIQSVSESGQFFSVSTIDGELFVCKAGLKTDFHEDVFSYRYLPVALKGLVKEVSALGFMGDKLIIGYSQPSETFSADKLVLDLLKEFPKIRLVDFMLVESDKASQLEKLLSESKPKESISFINPEAWRYPRYEAGFFGEDTVETAQHIFEKSGCVDANSKFVRKSDKDKVYTLKGGFVVVSKDEGHILSCTKDVLYLYRWID